MYLPTACAQGDLLCSDLLCSSALLVLTPEIHPTFCQVKYSPGLRYLFLVIGCTCIQGPILPCDPYQSFLGTNAAYAPGHQEELNVDVVLINPNSKINPVMIPAVANYGGLINYAAALFPSHFTKYLRILPPAAQPQVTSAIFGGP